MWLFLFIANVVAAVAFFGLAEIAAAVHYTDAYSTLREFESRDLIGVVPDGYSVLEKMRQIGGGGFYYRVIGYLAAIACGLNSLSSFGRFRSEASDLRESSGATKTVESTGTSTDQ